MTEYDKTYGKDSFMNAYFNENMVTLKLELSSLTKEHRETHRKRYMALTSSYPKGTTSEEKRDCRNSLNVVQKEWMKEKVTNVMSKEAQEKLIQEHKETKEKNDEFWTSLKE